MLFLRAPQPITALVPMLTGAACLRAEQVLSSHSHQEQSPVWPRLLRTAISSQGAEGREGWANLSTVKRFCFVLIKKKKRRSNFFLAKPLD